jgi:hypothetical protein
MNRARRPLRFSTLVEVTADVNALLAGHVTVGRWSLGQICNHLELAIRLPMDGVPVKYPRLVRRLYGPPARTLSFLLGWIPEGVRVPELYLPTTEKQAARESELLRATLQRYNSFIGQFDEHPLLGRMSRKQWDRFHCLHCAHHLSFAIPSR